METHPIPQQISSYQFRLVGDMTLKQFFQLGGGVLMALLIYSTSLHPLIKWPLILISISLGAALAFLPFEERPLSRWIIAFFRSVYSPTVYLWQKSDTGYDFFQPEETNPSFSQHPTQQKPEYYFKESPSEQEKSLSNLEAEEKNFLSRIISLFKQESYVSKITEQTAHSSMPITTPPQPKVKPEVIVPTTEPKSFRPKIVIEAETPQTSEKKQSNISLHQVSPILKESQTKSEQAQFSAQAAPPLPPTIPNTITGQVLSSDGKIIEGAILEIRDLAGRPVRAVRSNKLGHFMIVTALANGQYDIITEKEGYRFEPTTFEAKGEIIPPILIKAK
ncbi:MAG: hypothetical protein KatS3mg088_127 [Patescibacteria group bacterium]|nr:MAG: hypothetical protein KatS3mg088_127 [Patescibacteria group bacterium]